MSNILSAYMNVFPVCAWSSLPLPPLSFQRPENQPHFLDPPSQEMKLQILTE